jgi:hypothetical protein
MPERDDEREIRSFEEFWDFYVGEHRHPVNRAFHFVGSTAVLGCLAAGVLTRRPIFFLAAPVVGYGPAWIGHFFIEGNRPASFKYPLWSLRADYVMWWKIATRTMQAEVDRVVAAESAAAAAGGANGAEAASAGPTTSPDPVVN